MKPLTADERKQRPVYSGVLPTYQHARLIGFGHKARQGKDLAVKLLMEAFPGRVARVAFADSIRVVCRVQYGMTTKDAPLLQRVGVAARETDPDIWIRAAAWAIAELDAEADQPFLVCIPDTRFQNEAEFVRARGVTCRLVRLCDDGVRFVATDRPADHPSEIDLDAYDWQHTVVASTKDELRAGVVEIGRIVLGVPEPAHDERYAHAEPCVRQCGRICYPPGVCLACKRQSIRGTATPAHSATTASPNTSELSRPRTRRAKQR